MELKLDREARFCGHVRVDYHQNAPSRHQHSAADQVEAGACAISSGGTSEFECATRGNRSKQSGVSRGVLTGWGWENKMSTAALLNLFFEYYTTVVALPRVSPRS